MERAGKSREIAYKLLAAFAALIVFQSLLTAFALEIVGFPDEMRTNQYRIFSEKVNSRKNTLENQMRNVWIDFEKEAFAVGAHIEEMRREGVSEDTMLEELSPQLGEILYHTRTTGAFLVFPEEKEDHMLNAIYLRNNNPGSKSRDGGSLYMLVGPWEAAEKLHIATMANWSYRLQLTEENKDFVRVPCDAAGTLGRSEWLGYWSEPFRVNRGDEKVITYSVPIFDENDEVEAILGVEIALQYFYRFLPSSDLQKTDSYGYVIGTRSGVERLRSTIMYEALQHRVLEPGGPMDLEPISEGYDIFRLEWDGKEEMYACVKQMGLYYHNTPFEEHEWYLIGLMRKDAVLAFPDEVRGTLIWCFGISTVLSLAVAVVFSRWFTRNSRLMELAGVPVGVAEMDDHSERLRMTGGVSLLLGLSKAQERAFAADKYKFLSYVLELFQNGQEEENVFRREIGGRMRWIRMTKHREDVSWRYIFEDVTEEMLRTRALQRERDVDGLTGVKNRMAFKKFLEQKNRELRPHSPAVVIMCDLNDLKYVNDHFGHDAGDEYIREAVCKIRESFPEATVFRIGGDEFVVTADNMTPTRVKKSLERLENRLRDYSAGCEYGASVAVGAAFYDPEQDGQLEDTLSRADREMYRKKKEMKQE